MSERESVLTQIRTARLYTKEILRHIDDGDWFRQPSEGVTHVAWQVGHLAVAQYGLALKRVRGERPEDEGLISADFRSQFGKGSEPTAEASVYPSPDAIRQVLDNVHQRVLSEIAEIAEESLNEPVGEPAHPMFRTRLGALQWAAQHEYIHAGQLALLRRLFGAAPLR